ncbi:GTPase, partial [Pseudomonas syringae]
LYTIAQDNDFDDQDIKSKYQFSSSIKAPQTILDVYKQMCLLDILNTHQVRPVEIYELYQCSFQWVKFLKLSLKENNFSRYIIDLNKDFPP